MVLVFPPADSYQSPVRDSIRFSRKQLGKPASYSDFQAFLPRDQTQERPGTFPPSVIDARPEGVVGLCFLGGRGEADPAVLRDSLLPQLLRCGARDQTTIHRSWGQG